MQATFLGQGTLPIGCGMVMANLLPEAFIGRTVEDPDLPVTAMDGTKTLH